MDQHIIKHQRSKKRRRPRQYATSEDKASADVEQRRSKRQQAASEKRDRQHINFYNLYLPSVLPPLPGLWRMRISAKFSISASAIRLFQVGKYISASVSAFRQYGGYPPNPPIRLQKINVVLPSQSASQIQQLQFDSLAETQVEEFSTIQTESSTSLAPLHEPSRRAGLSKPTYTNWPWPYFDISEFENPLIVKKSNKRKLIDREIRCAVLDKETAEKCD
ncbi:hypothetical protein LIPSTDRAFT_30474 [Lipomyces starkeyi NRRL Y-11557]|uniref:Uncharacterized protein n=1 Tax=Lipomyces starkeyi NRRL Y-11557 TaxID=675824 RepID=A0A1E3PVK2_LIPST|nr:hypothetical protein LIPSTDRAFT_30474 [Lipomyces starkeyi NRRL Y-11557]